jgi:hypothetical protein
MPARVASPDTIAQAQPVEQAQNCELAHFFSRVGQIGSAPPIVSSCLKEIRAFLHQFFLGKKLFIFSL